LGGSFGVGWSQIDGGGGGGWGQDIRLSVSRIRDIDLRLAV
jgi:hypothetical protein